MGRLATRSAFAATLCAGVAMVGASVYGMLGVDAELQRSALAAQELRQERNTFRVVAPPPEGECGAPPRSMHRS